MSGNEVILNVPFQHTCGNAQVRILRKTLCLQIYGKENSIDNRHLTRASQTTAPQISNINIRHVQNVCWSSRCISYDKVSCDIWNTGISYITSQSFLSYLFKVSNGYLYILKPLLSPAESVASYGNFPRWKKDIWFSWKGNFGHFKLTSK